MKYKKDRPCSKCGEIGTKDYYKCDSKRDNRGIGDYEPFRADRFITVNERIIRVCLNCEHKWKEEPINKEKNE